jgi:biopolymer transport protein ExbD
MGVNLKSSSSSRKRHQVISEINVTPFVDVMLSAVNCLYGDSSNIDSRESQ